MSQSALPVPARPHALPDGVHVDGNLSIDAWASVYLDTGDHWRDWLNEWQIGQRYLARQLLELYACARETVQAPDMYEGEPEEEAG